MNDPKPRLAALLIHRNLLMILVLVMLTYGLGLAILRYLGKSIETHPAVYGLMITLLITAGTFYLRDYFDTITAKPALSARPVEKKLLLEARMIQSLLVAAMSVLTAAALLIVLLLREGYVSGEVAIIVFIGFIGAYLYSSPPARLAYSGIGEIVAALLVCNVVPAFGLLLQGAELNRLLTMTTFPITAIFFAQQIAWQFPDYAADCKNCRAVLLVRLGWQRGMTAHHLSIVAGYGILAAALLLGMPWRIVYPLLFTLPIAVFQLWQMAQVSGGAKPKWGLLQATSAGLVLLWIYLFLFTFWTV